MFCGKHSCLLEWEHKCEWSSTNRRNGPSEREGERDEREIRREEREVKEEKRGGGDRGKEWIEKEWERKTDKERDNIE